MPTEETLLTPDTRSSGYKSLSDYCNRAIAPFFFRPEVPDVIRKQLATVHKLLIHTFYEYEFFDIALVRATQIFEMALKTRYAEIEGIQYAELQKPKKKISLFELIEWADKIGILELPEPFVQNLREIRNHVTHGDPTHLMGFPSLTVINLIVDFINDLYEDIGIRERRHKIEREIQQVFTEITEHGSILTLGHTRLVTFQAKMLVCMIEDDAISCHAGFFPIFDARKINHSFSTPDPIMVKFCSYEFIDESFILTDGSGNKVRIESISDDANSNKYNDFLSEFNKNPILGGVLNSQLQEIKRDIKQTYVKSISEQIDELCNDNGESPYLNDGKLKVPGK